MAVSTRITYATTAQSGGIHLANAVRYAQLAQQEIALAVGVANSITGGGVTPANLEGSAEFGAATGQGSNLYTAMSNFKANLSTVTTAQISDLYTG